MASPVPQIPFRAQISDKDGNLTATWANWFVMLYQRVGGKNALTNLELASYIFTVTPLTVQTNIGAVYTNNAQKFTVTSTSGIGSVTLFCSGAGNPAASGNLVKISGTGQSTISFTSLSLQSQDLSTINSQITALQTSNLSLQRSILDLGKGRDL